MPELSINDVIQLYEGTLCKHKETFVKIEAVKSATVVSVFDLRTQRRKDLPFKLEDFGAPLGRIGFVNHCNWAFYITRQPVRRYQVGASPNNIQIKCPGWENPAHHPLAQASSEIKNLKLATIMDSLEGNYPTFNDALDKAVERKGLYAFDKQFAISYDRNIFFRTEFVGILPPRTRKKERIVFQQRYEHLELLLNQDYEKTARTFAA